MTITQTDPRPHLAAVISHLNTHLAPRVAYSWDTVPGSPLNWVEAERSLPLPTIYVAVSIEPRYVPPTGLVPRSSRGGWRLSTFCTGRSVNECQWAIARVMTALRNQSFVVADERVGSAVLESAAQPEPDDGRFSAELMWTYST